MRKQSLSVQAQTRLSGFKENMSVVDREFTRKEHFIVVKAAESPPHLREENESKPFKAFGKRESAKS